MIRVPQKIITEEMAACTQKTLLLDKNKQINASKILKFKANVGIGKGAILVARIFSPVVPSAH